MEDGRNRRIRATGNAAAMGERPMSGASGNSGPRLLRFCLALLLVLLPAHFARAQQDGVPSGEVAGLSFQDVPIRFALQILADEQDFNLVAGETVTGNITLQLDGVPWEQALELVLQAGNLAYRLEGNVLFVTTAEEMALQREQELEAERQALNLTPLVTELLQVNYADAAVLLDLILGSGAAADPGASTTDPDASAAPSAGIVQAGNRGLLSPRGSASVDVRTNTIIVQDMERNLAATRDLLASLDVPVRQVLIEARIVNVSTDYSREFGVRWGAAGLPEPGSRFRYGFARGLAPAQAQNELALDLGMASRTTFNIGYTGNSELIELELAAIESSGNGEIIARPKVTTQDKVTAEIRSGVRIPYQSQAGGAAGGSVTQFEDAVLLLRVTPRITPNGQINMQLEIRQDSISPTASGVPSINTNEVLTSALVDDGETIVLGGVFREEATATESKTPILGDIPGLEWLFKRTVADTRRTELLIFITPGIVPATL
ncbi:MAG: type IV pilus secretin PilQ [Gammaproteobacteria bacterium]|nr:type IV pilus secretin PilQ [Gammaproteobacteria bacterium]MYE30437.1 type IV pilus secretin PilQ [Gammaproteobacteria bacterium]MYI01597.1 type IV pilus secretin PilQ [Gammaproteobacteria bacterium]